MKAKCLVLASFCFASANWLTQASARDPAAAPMNYRQLIAAGDLVATLREKLNLLSPLEVSQLRPSVLTQPGEWIACVRVSNSGLKSPPTPNPSDKRPVQRISGAPRTAYYAVFFDRGGVILESRPAVIIDRCADMTYSPLPNPVKTGKKKRG